MRFIILIVVFCSMKFLCGQSTYNYYTDASFEKEIPKKKADFVIKAVRIAGNYGDSIWKIEVYKIKKKQSWLFGRIYNKTGGKINSWNGFFSIYDSASKMEIRRIELRQGKRWGYTISFAQKENHFYSYAPEQNNFDFIYDKYLKQGEGVVSEELEKRNASSSRLISILQNLKNDTVSHYVISIINYRDNVATGMALEFNGDTSLSPKLFNMKDGRLTGRSYQWYSNGKLYSAQNYSNEGEINDTQYYYHPNGTIACKEVYEEDSLLSYKWFNKKGVVVKEGEKYEYRNDQELADTFSARFTRYIYEYYKYPEIASQNDQGTGMICYLYVYPSGAIKVCGIHSTNPKSDYYEFVPEMYRVIDKLGIEPFDFHNVNCPLLIRFPILLKVSFY